MKEKPKTIYFTDDSDNIIGIVDPISDDEFTGNKATTVSLLACVGLLILFAILFYSIYFK